MHGPNFIKLMSIDSSVFKPYLLENSNSKGSYICYCFGLFIIIGILIFFITLNVSTI